MLFYIQLINKTWHPPNSPEFLQNSTTNKPELEIKNGLRKLRATNASFIRNIQQVYYLKRR